MKNSSPKHQVGAQHNSKKYNIIYVDPPWHVKAGPGWGSSGKSRDLTYPTMSLEEIRGLDVKSIAEDDCHLYLWVINKYIPQAYEIVKGWGFNPSTMITWCKPAHGIGLGGTYVQTTEHLLFCRRGTLSSRKRVDTTWFAYPRGRHSKKPDEFRNMIVDTSGNLPRVELFAREKSSGWDVWGNEVDCDVIFNNYPSAK